MRMRAYYYSFEATGVDGIDRILSAVATAGKGFHHTSDWSDPSESIGGKSYVDLIQEAANDAAAAQAFENLFSRDRALVEAVAKWAESRQSNLRNRYGNTVAFASAWPIVASRIREDYDAGEIKIIGGEE